MPCNEQSGSTQHRIKQTDISVYKVGRLWKFKESWPSGDDIARTAIAFANGAGGKIVFGVREEPREIIGISDAELFALEEKAQH